MRCDLADDPAVIGIARTTHLNVDEVVGKLQRLWSWADANTADGRMPWVDGRAVDEKAGKRGFAAAMQLVRWLEIDADGVVFPNFDRHNGASAKARALDKNRKQTGRMSDNIPENVREMSGSEPDKTRTREREEVEIEKNKNLNPSTVERGAGAEAPQAPKKRATRLPEGWELPLEWADWAMSERREWNRKTMLRVSLEFRDHWLSKGEARADWEATWRNWVRREKARAPPNGKHSLAERRTQTLDAITGVQPNERDITSVTARVDSETVHPVPVDLRQPGGDDVGPIRPGRPARNVGR